MTIHKEGFATIALTIGFISLLLFISFYFFGNNAMVKYSSVIVSVVLLLIVLQFFRSPARTVAINEKYVYAPADGKVVAIEEVHEKEYLNDKRVQISIFMSPLNVHVNWNPVSGKVKYARYHPGSYLVAWHPKSSTENERTTFVIETNLTSAGTGKKIEILFRQIAGAMARRIVYYIKEGDEVAQGGQMGFIKFGSRVDVLVPPEAKINVSIDQAVKGGKTAIASFA